MRASCKITNRAAFDLVFMATARTAWAKQRLPPQCKFLVVQGLMGGLGCPWLLLRLELKVSGENVFSIGN